MTTPAPAAPPQGKPPAGAPPEGQPPKGTPAEGQPPEGTPPAGATPEAGLPTPENPYDFDVEVNGKKGKVTFKDKESAKKALQKAIYADQMTKNAKQATDGANFVLGLMQKAKAGDWSGIRELATSPEYGFNLQKFALDLVNEMIEDDKLTPEAREAKKLRTEVENLRKEKDDRVRLEKEKASRDKNARDGNLLRGKIIESLKEFPDLDVNQATMDGVLQNMRTANRLLMRQNGNKPLTMEQLIARFPPKKAVEIYYKHYWDGVKRSMGKLTPEQRAAKLGDQVFDEHQKALLTKLRTNTRAGGGGAGAGSGGAKPEGAKGKITQKEYESKNGIRTAGL
jgi:hypothetical protein